MPDGLRQAGVQAPNTEVQATISVIVRCYNEARHIGNLLFGLSHQTLEHEVIVVDSGSTDGTLDVAREYNPTIITIPKAEFSFGRSLNLGCEHASGDILVAISAHCRPVHHDWLLQLLKPFADPKVAMAYGKQRGGETNHFSEHGIFADWFGEVSDFNQKHPFANNANSAFRRSLWQEFPFDETLTGLEDLDWCHRTLARGHRIAYVAEADVVHIHEETWPQVRNRYRREAMAMRRIMPNARFGLFDFLRLWPASIYSDLARARRDHRLWRELRSILSFRTNQYLGTLKGYRQNDSLSSALKEAFYYPRRNGRSPATFRDETRAAIVYPQTPPAATTPSAPDVTVVAPATTHFRGTVPTSRSRHLLDISVAIDEKVPVWPGEPRPVLTRMKSQADGDPVTSSHLSLGSHTATHVDAPAHFCCDGATVETLALETLVGLVDVIDVGNVAVISASVLQSAAIPADCQRLLIRSRNGDTWREGRVDFDEAYVALTPDAAGWLIARGIRLVGIDYLSIERYGEPGNKTHVALLEAGIIILEGLNLNDAPLGRSELICLPLKVAGAEGAPARAVLAIPSGQ